MIRFENVTKMLGGNTVLDNISFEVAEGETLVIVGLSGAGKSVTLKHMIRLMLPDSGNVMIEGEAINQLIRSQICIPESTPFIS
jgi:ABC-type transporter Mla maintaining outer membrane lipid asymmetry ATPase subunit MlaF